MITNFSTVHNRQQTKSSLEMPLPEGAPAAKILVLKEVFLKSWRLLRKMLFTMKEEIDAWSFDDIFLMDLRWG